MQNAEISQQAGETLKKVTAAARDRARGESERLIGEARDEARGFVVERRDVAASYVVDVADALDSATQVLDERGRSTSAHYVRRVADELHQFGERVNRQDVGRWIGEIETFARSQPLLFFGGAFLIGYAAIRLLGVDIAGDGDEQRAYEAEGYEAASTEGAPPEPMGPET